MIDISESGIEAAVKAHNTRQDPTLYGMTVQDYGLQQHAREVVQMTAAIQAYLPFHPPASREEGLRTGLTKILNVDLNVTDEELLRIRNMCERDGDVKIWARMVQKLTDAVRQGREALREQS